MTNNQILRRLRYCFDFRDSRMIEIFAHVNCEVNKEEVCSWLKSDEDEGFVNCPDV